MRNGKAAFKRRAFDERILAVQHYVVVNVGSLLDPVTARFGVRTLHNELIQHRLEYLGDW